jgi:hypothetical protein
MRVYRNGCPNAVRPVLERALRMRTEDDPRAEDAGRAVLDMLRAMEEPR